MLVFTRKECEKFKIGNDITITVVKIHGSQVRIGIEAPRDMAVAREELVVAAEELANAK